MNLKITKTVFIDIDEIIEYNYLDYNSSDMEVQIAVEDYLSSLEDCDYYLIGEEEEEKIKKEVRKKIGKQMTLF